MKTLDQLGVLTRRIMKQNLTNLDTLITVIAMPVFMLLLFVYVMGGNMVTSNGASPSTAAYLTYALPGFCFLTMTMGSAYTALRINSDQTKGFLQRLHSLPIPRWVILCSHVVASVLFMLLAELLVLIVGLLLGFRMHATWQNGLLFAGLSIMFALAITLLAIPFSLKASNYASAGGFSYLLLMLLFVSSALMPTTGMAKPVRLFAEHQPMTAIVNVGRGLLDNHLTITTGSQISAVLWLVGGILICAASSWWVYQRVYVRR